MRHIRFFALLVGLAGGAQLGAVSGQTDGLLRHPTIAGDTIAFAAEGDLWKVAADGGVASRVTAHEGDEQLPQLSHDGQLLAFTAQYDGNDEVYVMSVAGGEPRRLTFHPESDKVVGWTADGRVLFRSRRDHPHGDNRIYSVSPVGGASTLIPLEPAARVSFEPGGSRVALQKMALEFHNWKRYKGGEAEDIEVGTVSPLEFSTVTRYEGKDAFPMWADDGRIYFITDRWGRPNLASMSPDGSDVRQLTRFTDYDVRWPSLGGDRIVYQHRMDVWRFDTKTGLNRKVDIVLPSDRLQVRSRQADPRESIRYWSLSSDGQRIAIESRGEAFVARTHRKGLIRQITDNGLARSKTPVFSPDGNSIAAWTEVDGEEQLVLHSSDNGAPPRTLGAVEPGWHFAPTWSPDGRRLAWGDQRHRLAVTDATNGTTTFVENNGGFEITRYVWSPDSRYLAYVVVPPSLLGQIRIWDSHSLKSAELTDPLYHSFSPAWDPKGKYLYFLSDRHINPLLDRLEFRFIVDQATVPFVVGLKRDGTLPFAPRGDRDPQASDASAGAVDSETVPGKDAQPRTGGAKSAEPKPIARPIEIDLEGLPDRVVQIPVAPGNYDELRAIDGKLHWLRFVNRGMMPYEDTPERPEAELVTYEFAKEKLSTVTGGVISYDVSRDGTALVYQTKTAFMRVAAGTDQPPKDEEAKEAQLDLSGWTMSINPRAEWKQMLREAWRLQRDFFYDPAMHGVNWDAVLQQYAPLAERISSRDDLSDLLGEMFGELNVGHAYNWGGDVRRGKPVGVGLLAADFVQDPATGFWQLKKVYSGDYPDPKVSSPLARPDLRVSIGQWLVAIDGRPLISGQDYLERLANRGNQEVELSFNDKPALQGARRVVVRTVSSDHLIRYATWVKEKRLYVSKASDGQLGYIHLYDMGGLGLRQFARDYPGQWRKRGLIVDDRWNRGGFVAPMILAHLDRKVLAVGGTRYGYTDTTPPRAFTGYMAALINRQGGSDCETLALGFKEFNLGPVIGTRTWGGWVGIRADKALRDGGMTTQPEWGGWDPKGERWLIEGHGVDPDVELDLEADGFINGRDAQLDYAIQHLLDLIRKEPRDLPAAPPVPPRPLQTSN